MPIARFIVMGIAKTLSKVFGLATVTFFGRVPSRDDDKMALVGLLSLTWIPVVVAIPFPEVGELVPGMPEDDGLRQMLAAATAVVIPLVNGATISRLHNRPGGVVDLAKQLVFGFPYTAIIGGVVVGVVIVAPLVKATYVLRRFENQHLMVMIFEEQYDDLVDQLVELLEAKGAQPRVAQTNKLIRMQFRALTFVVERIFRRDVASQMKVIRGEFGDGGWYEITIHATDITILGKDEETSMLLPMLADELDERLAYFTWDDESQEIEDEMRDRREALERGEDVDPAEVAELAERVRGIGLDKEEWGALRRNLYRLERDALQERLRALQHRDDAADASREGVSARSGSGQDA